MELVKAGKVQMTASYHYDDMTGESRGGVMPVRFSIGYGDFVEGYCNLREHDFTSSCGRAYMKENGLIGLVVHSNCSYEFKLIDGATIGPANKGATKAKRPENARMQAFLKANGIDATPRYLWEGSMRGCWQVYNPAIPWTDELREKLTALGFLDFDNQPLGQFSGNGGVFSVALRGHNELLNDPQQIQAD